MQRVVIIDYGLCNLDSIRRAIEMCGGDPVVTSDPEELATANSLVLPGVGSFGIAMANLRQRGMDEAIRQQVTAGIPLLGICLGMQLLSSRSEEGGDHEGLNLIPGEVRLLNEQSSDDRVPHIGWNSVTSDSPGELLLKDISSGTDFYFVHSYHVKCATAAHSVATTPYCGEFTSVVRRDNVCGTQFHPEKSQRAGFQLLANFLEQ